tara:strand:+ start:291487 stop:291858 length:372 start_codon:yes stop_codon:yes gene_type:complete
MDTLRPSAVKASRIRKLRDIDRLKRDTKELHDQIVSHYRERKRIARNARKLAKTVRKRFPDMTVTGETLTLEEYYSELASRLYIAPNENAPEYDPQDPIHRAESALTGIFAFLEKLLDVPWIR